MIYYFVFPLNALMQRCGLNGFKFSKHSNHSKTHMPINYWQRIDVVVPVELIGHVEVLPVPSVRNLVWQRDEEFT